MSGNRFGQSDGKRAGNVLPLENFSTHAWGTCGKCPGNVFDLLSGICSLQEKETYTAIAIMAKLLPNPVDQDDMCRVCVQLYKYLMPAFLDQFEHALLKYVADAVEIVEAVDLADKQHADNLATLYGSAVLPKRVLDVYNSGFRKPRHYCPAGSDIRAVRSLFFDVLNREILRIDEHPVCNRMFTFTECCWAILRMKLLGLPSSIFTTSTKKPQPENAGRLNSVRTFYDSPGSLQLLKQVGLSLRLAHLAMSITAQKSTEENKREPALVRLGRAEVQTRTAALFSEIVDALRCDDGLDHTAALTQMIITMMHLIIRFSEFLAYPTRGFKITRKYNRVDCLAEMLYLLHAPAEKVDVGFFSRSPGSSLEQRAGRGERRLKLFGQPSCPRKSGVRF